MKGWLIGISLTWLALNPLGLHADTCDGDLTWSVRAELSLPVSGVIASVTATPGTTVRSGQELVSLDAPPFEARLMAAQAETDGTGAEYEEQKRALARAEELYERGVSSTVELDHAKLLLAKARSAHQAAQAALKLAHYELDRSRLKAPFDGLVLATYAVPGQSITSGLQPPVLVVLAEANRYRVRCWAPIAVAARVQPGDRLKVSMDGGSHTGDVQAVGLESRVVKPGGDRQVALDIMLTVQERVPVGSRVTVELP
jgi:multidrug efflux system membrane fusion protein